MTALDDLITRANNVLSVLEGFIGGDAGKTPIPDPSVSYTLPLITYNAETSAWTLTQATVDPVDGLYKGQFILALDSGCATLTINSHNVTTPGDDVPARIKAPPSEEDPTPSFVDVLSVAALGGQQFNAFLIRSSTAFEVQVQVGECETTGEWCWTWDFTANYSGFAYYTDGGCGPGTWVEHSGWNPTSSCDGYLRTTNAISLTVPDGCAIRYLRIDVTGFQTGFITQWMITPDTYANRIGCALIGENGGQLFLEADIDYDTPGSLTAFFNMDRNTSLGFFVTRVTMSGTGTAPTFVTGGACS